MTTRLLVAADLHLPLHDQDAVDELLKRIRSLHPDVVCLAGDVLDFDSLSSFLSDPDGAKLQHELDQAREFFKLFRKAVGRAKWDFCLGNHEDRLRQFLWKNPAVAKLDALQLHSLLGIPADRIHPFGEPVKYGEIVCYHTETQGTANANQPTRAQDRLARTGAQVVVTAHMHTASTVFTTDRAGLGCSVVTPCLQGQADWTRPAPNWHCGWTEISVIPGRFPIVQQVLL